MTEKPDMDTQFQFNNSLNNLSFFLLKIFVSGSVDWRY
jgi:hypothetical protein